MTLFLFFLSVEEIVKKIEEIGFNVSLNKEQQLTKEIACQLYADHKDSEYFEELTDYMSRYEHVHVRTCNIIIINVYATIVHVMSCICTYSTTDSKIIISFRWDTHS